MRRSIHAEISVRVERHTHFRVVSRLYRYRTWRMTKMVNAHKGAPDAT